MKTENILGKIPAVIIETAEESRVELYAVGGAVRDCLLDRDVNDIDFSVVGDPLALVRKISTKHPDAKTAYYKNFGTASLILEGNTYEFAVSRSESYQPDSRKPSEVVPVTIQEDLKRRDFTFNAMAYGITGQHKSKLLDEFEGLKDLEKGVVRTPLNPDETFSDDPLRMFRAIRFAAQLGFTFDLNTWDGIQKNLHRVEILAKERIKDELLKMLAGADPVRAMRLLIECGLMKTILPEVVNLGGVEQVGKHHHKDVLIHSLKVMQNVVYNSRDPILRFAALLHDIGKPQTKRFIKGTGWTFHGHEFFGLKMVGRIGKRLKLGKEITNRLEKYVGLHMRPINLTAEGVTESAIRRLMFDCGELLDDQMILCKADITSAREHLVETYLKNFEEMRVRMDDVEARDKMRNFNSPVRGDEIIEICQIKPGPYVGELKERIEDAILDNLIPNEYEAAKDYLLKIKDEVLSSSPAEISKRRKERAQERSHITREFIFPDE